MKVPEKPLTQEKLIKIRNEYIKNKTVLLSGRRLECRKCKSIINEGLALCIAVDKKGNIRSDRVISVRIPYCPKCDDQPDVANKNCYSKVIEIITDEG